LILDAALMFIAVLWALAIVAAMASLLIGPAPLGVTDVFGALLGHGSDTTQIIVWDLRAPRTALALMIGATMAMSGATLQGQARNPLASPEILGASSFAALGAVLAMYFGASQTFPLAVPLSAIFMSGISVVALLLLAGRDSRILTLILAGLALSSLAGALTSLALSLSPNPFAVSEIAFWLLGSLANRSSEHLTLAAPFMLACWALLIYDRKVLLALTLGDDVALTLGADVWRAQFRLMLAVAMGVGAAVAVAGVIGFVGLVTPHVVRPLVGYDPAKLIVPSGLAGAALLCLADCATRLIPATGEVRLGVLTALIGVPFFLFLVFRERRGRPAFL
jgi:iron complex transport system permease protein